MQMKYKRITFWCLFLLQWAQRCMAHAARLKQSLHIKFGLTFKREHIFQAIQICYNAQELWKVLPSLA